MQRRTSVAILTVLMALPAVAAAQGLNARPRVEVGGGFRLLIDLNGVLKGLGPRVTVNVNDRLAVESGFEIDENRSSNFSSLLGGTHVTQIKYAVRPGDATHARVFVTGGLLGFFSHEHFYGLQYTRYDGIVESLPSHTSNTLANRLTPTVGVGVERSLGREIGVRADVLAGHAHDGGVLLRASVGVTFPIGHYR